MSRFLPYHYRGADGSLVRFKKRKSRFTFQEVQLLLNEVKNKRHILVGKFNKGISKELKHRTWAALTARINEISECHREVIEVIKKWADLKCDTKRRVAALRASGATAAQIAQELSPVETMVHQILLMSNSNKNTTTVAIEDQVDEDSGEVLVISEVPHGSSGMANGIPHSFGLAMPPSMHTRISGKRDMAPPIDVIYDDDPAVPLTDPQIDMSGKEDDNTLFIEPESPEDQHTVNIPEFFNHPGAKKSNARVKANHTFNGCPASSVATFTPPSTSSSLPAPPPSQHPPVDPCSLQEHLAQSASLSLQEQQATTLLIGSFSRSLESLAESMQRLVQTQQQFSRETLQLQRETLNVLRDFSSSTLTLLQDKINGHP